MKRVVRQSEPELLKNYAIAFPNSTWQEMRSDAHFNGPEAYDACRAQIISDQGGICAFCEIDIRDNDPLKCRIEHFHPKSDVTPAHNWALDWSNMLGVCAGGSYAYTSAPWYLPPIRENLSCDSHKDQMIQSGKLLEKCEGWILNPAQIQALPTLFRIEKSTGKLWPNLQACDRGVEGLANHHPDLHTLVKHTIEMLNLNCDRLNQARLAVVHDIERNKKKQRLAGHSPEQGLHNLVLYYMRRHWPGFFTTIFLCLGNAAEAHLTEMNYQG